MVKTDPTARPRAQAPERQFVIIGAGMCGLYQLHKLLDMGADVTVLERGEVVHTGSSRALADDLDLRRQVLWL